MGSFFLDISQVIFTFMLDIHKLACNTGVSFSKQGIDIMKNITQHTGKLRLMERLPSSRNGNPRYLCAIMDQQPNQDLGWTFRTQVDAMHGYEVPNYFDSDIDVTVTIGTHYGCTILNSIRKA